MGVDRPWKMARCTANSLAVGLQLAESNATKIDVAKEVGRLQNVACRCCSMCLCLPGAAALSNLAHPRAVSEAALPSQVADLH